MTHSIASVLGPRTTWYIARASGLTAWCLVLASVLLGLFMSSKPKWKGLPPAWRLDLHRFLGALAVFFTLLHVAALMIDPFVPFGVVDVLVPFASTWHPRAIAGGVIGLYLILVVEVTSLMMRKLPRKWWHRIHLSSLVLLAAATVHGLMSGTDMGNRAVEDVLVVAGVLTVPFAVFRVWRARRQPSVAARTAGATAAGDHPRRDLARSPRARTHDEHVRRAADEAGRQAEGARP
jgi:DMSO/TMAO reductase YedYZ heme-binding membrane subunit